MTDTKWRNEHGLTHAQRAEVNYIRHILDSPIMKWVCQEFAYIFSHRSTIWGWDGEVDEDFNEEYEIVQAKLEAIYEGTIGPGHDDLMKAIKESGVRNHEKRMRGEKDE